MAADASSLPHACKVSTLNKMTFEWRHHHNQKLYFTSLQQKNTIF